MTATTDDSQEELGRTAERSFWASFSRGDARLFAVTFAGTVAANVVTVMVVAVALIAARPENSSRPTPGSVLIYLGCVVFGLLTVCSGLSAVRRPRPKGDRADRAIGAVLLAVTAAMGLITLVFVLILLGCAVGVK